jgi:bacterioferritin-associated ferredoxin
VYVCHCKAVSDCRIREVIADGATDLVEVARRSGAGITCGGCLPAVERLLCEQGHPDPLRSVRRLREQLAPGPEPQPAARP